MRKVLIFLAAAGSALAMGSPAAAQYFPVQQPYGYGQGYYQGYNQYGHIRALQDRINRVERNIDRLDRRNVIRERTARNLREEARSVERRLRYASGRGLSPWESNDMIVAAVSEIARRYPGWGGLVASLPLTSLLAMIWLFRDTHDAERVAELSVGTFWFFLPSIPLFVVLPQLIRSGVGFWLSMSLAGELRDEADERQLALARLAKIELQHPDDRFDRGDLVKLDGGIADDRFQLRVVHDQPREPQPGRADLAEQGAILIR